MSSLRTVLIPVALIFGLLCSGCAAGPAFRGPIRLSSNAEIGVVRAVAHRTNDGMVVDGDVRRPNGYAGVVAGHLRIEGKDAAGSVVVATDAAWGEFMNRRLRLAYFRAVLPAGDPTAIASISIEPITGEAR